MLIWQDGLQVAGLYSLGFNLGVVMSVAMEPLRDGVAAVRTRAVPDRVILPGILGQVFSYYVLAFGALSLLFCSLSAPGRVITGPTGVSRCVSRQSGQLPPLLLLGMASILGIGILMAKETWVFLIVELASTVAALSSGLLLVHWLGLAGASLTLLAGMGFFVVCLRTWNVRRAATYPGLHFSRLRVFGFLLLYAVLVAALQLPRATSIQQELVLAVGGLLPLSARYCCSSGLKNAPGSSILAQTCCPAPDHTAKHVIKSLACFLPQPRLWWQSLGDK